MEQVSPNLEEALHGLIPQCTDKTLRRKLLALKRDVHNRRTPSLPTEQEEAITHLLCGQVSNDWSRWRKAASDRDLVYQRAKMAFEKELRRSTKMLDKALRDPLFQQGLAMASPEFAAAVLRNKESEKHPDSRFSRSAFSYLVRATAKTSPLTTFTRIGHARLDEEVVPPNGPPLAFVQPNRALVTTLLWACCLHPDLAPAFRFTASPGLSSGSVVHHLLPEHGFQNGVFSRVDRVVDRRAYTQLISLVQGIQDATYQECLDLIGTSDPHALFSRLLQLHLIEPVAPWARDSRNPLLDLAGALAGLRNATGELIAEQVSASASVVEIISEAPAAEHLEQIGRVRRSASTVLRTLGQMVPNWVQDGPLAYEDVGVPHAIPALGRFVEDDLYQVAAWMRRHIIRSHLYDKLIDFFVQRYGKGGTCDNVLQFFCSVLEREENWQLIPDSMRQDVLAATSPDHPRTRSNWGRGSIPPSASAFFQIAAKSQEDIHSGNYLLVVNDCSGGHVGALLRFARTIPGEAGLLSATRQWMNDLCGGHRTVQVPIYTEWNSLQFQTVESLDVLDWPAEGRTTDTKQPLPLDQLRLVHNPHNQTLELQAQDGTPLSLQHLGVVPKHMVVGPMSLLLTIADPWFNGALCSAKMGAWTGLVQPPDSVESFPRLAEGRIVFRRAYWRIPPDTFPVPRTGEDDFSFFERVQTWRRQYQLPVEVYLSTERPSLTFDANHRKPMLLRFDSIHSLHTVRPMLAGDVLAIRLEESLPSSSDCWLTGEDGLPRSSEFIAKFRWSPT